MGKGVREILPLRRTNAIRVISAIQTTIQDHE